MFVLKHFAMRPLPGVRLTLVARDLHTPYSGMLPGFIAGHYRFDDAHIDLQALARRCGVRLVHAEVNAIDADARLLRFENRPPLGYDLLSINIGSRPGTVGFAEADNQFSVKPVDRFVAAWRRLEQRLDRPDATLSLAIVGAGAGGVELALSLDYRARQLAGDLEIDLLTDRAELLPDHNPKVRKMLGAILSRRGIRLHTGAEAVAFDGTAVQTADRQSIASDAVIWVTHASAPLWLRQSGLALDEAGFIEVDESLQSRSHPQVFAAGDIASVVAYPRPRSGVFAVRQGIPLARNLARYLRRQPLKPFHPQSRFLSLISTGERYAVASRGNWAFRGKWCWRLKDWIDRRFVRGFAEWPKESGSGPETPDLNPMRCAGCGSKVGSAILEPVLERIRETHGLEFAPGLDQPDDAALIEVPPGKQLLQSVDHFRAFTDDAFLFGRIAANHALGDLFAMGASADSAMIIASVPFASEAMQAEELYQLMSGIAVCLSAHQVKLAGGHSGEAGELACGLSVNGFAEPDQILQKSGLRPGDVLILNKPLGSGVLLAADMRGRARGDWIETAFDGMLLSNRAAAECLRRFGAGACTDVTGFGLAGHLFEMTRASACAAEIQLDAVPLLPGAVEVAAAGILSSLQPQNRRIGHQIDDPHGLAACASYPLLFDPQTAGGLLAGVPADRGEACLAQLHRGGYSDAVIVGRVIEADDGAALRLVNS